MFVDGAINGDLHGVILLHIVFVLLSSCLFLCILCLTTCFVLPVFTLSKPNIFDLLISKVELSLAASYEPCSFVSADSAEDCCQDTYVIVVVNHAAKVTFVSIMLQ